MIITTSGRQGGCDFSLAKISQLSVPLTASSIASSAHWKPELCITKSQREWCVWMDRQRRWVSVGMLSLMIDDDKKKIRVSSFHWWAFFHLKTFLIQNQKRPAKSSHKKMSDDDELRSWKVPSPVRILNKQRKKRLCFVMKICAKEKKRWSRILSLMFYDDEAKKKMMKMKLNNGVEKVFHVSSYISQKKTQMKYFLQTGRKRFLAPWLTQERKDESVPVGPVGRQRRPSLSFSFVNGSPIWSDFKKL